MRGHQVDEAQVEPAEPAQVGDPEHGRDDRSEHHFEHGHVVQVELRRQLARAAEAGTLEEEAEAGAEDEGEDEGHLVAEKAVLVEGSHDYRHCQRMNQATA